MTRTERSCRLREVCRRGHTLDSGPRGRGTLTTADYGGYGNSSGTAQFLVVTKDDIGESRLALNALMKSNWVVIPTALGEMFYCKLVPPCIIEKSILFNIVESMHDTVTKMMSMRMFSRSMIRINTIWNH